MKIEIEIKTDDIVDQVAQHVMGYVVRDNQDYSYDDGESGDVETTAPKYRGETIANLVKNVVMERTRRAVDEAVKEVTGEHVRAAVAAILEEGWQKTNSYGEPTGPKMDLKARIGALLVEVQDTYSSNRRPWIENIVREQVDKTFAAVFAKEIEGAKAKFRAALDGTISAKLQESLKSALGLR